MSCHLLLSTGRFEDHVTYSVAFRLIVTSAVASDHLHLHRSCGCRAPPKEWTTATIDQRRSWVADAKLAVIFISQLAWGSNAFEHDMLHATRPSMVQFPAYSLPELTKVRLRLARRDLREVTSQGCTCLPTATVRPRCQIHVGQYFAACCCCTRHTCMQWKAMWVSETSRLCSARRAL